MTTRARKEKSHAAARSSSRARAGTPSIFHRCAIDLDAGTPPVAGASCGGAPPSGADDMGERAIGMYDDADEVNW
jgi:hypothetical protein